MNRAQIKLLAILAIFGSASFSYGMTNRNSPKRHSRSSELIDAHAKRTLNTNSTQLPEEKRASMLDRRKAQKSKNKKTGKQVFEIQEPYQDEVEVKSEKNIDNGNTSTPSPNKKRSRRGKRGSGRGKKTNSAPNTPAKKELFADAGDVETIVPESNGAVVGDAHENGVLQQEHDNSSVNATETAYEKPQSILVAPGYYYETPSGVQTDNADLGAENNTGPAVDRQLDIDELESYLQNTVPDEPNYDWQSNSSSGDWLLDATTDEEKRQEKEEVEVVSDEQWAALERLEKAREEKELKQSSSKHATHEQTSTVNREPNAYVNGVDATNDLIRQERSLAELSKDTTNEKPKKLSKKSSDKKAKTAHDDKAADIDHDDQSSWFKKVTNNTGATVLLGGAAVGTGYVLYTHSNNLQDKVTRAVNRVRSKSEITDFTTRLKSGKFTKTDVACLAALLVGAYTAHKASSYFGIYKAIADHKKLLLGAAATVGLGALIAKYCTQKSVTWQKEYQQFVLALSLEERAVLETYINNLEKILEEGARDPQGLKNNEVFMALLSQEQVSRLDKVVEHYHRQTTVTPEAV